MVYGLWIMVYGLWLIYIRIRILIATIQTENQILLDLRSYFSVRLWDRIIQVQSGNRNQNLIADVCVVLLFSYIKEIEIDQLIRSAPSALGVSAPHLRNPQFATEFLKLSIDTRLKDSLPPLARYLLTLSCNNTKLSLVTY